MRVARRQRGKSSPADAQELHQVEPASPSIGGTAPSSPTRARERRSYARARLALPISVSRIAGQPNPKTSALRVKDISSSGAFFLYPLRIEPGTPVVLEVSLIEERPRHRAVRMCADAHVVRTQETEKPGWHGLAVVFDDIRYIRNGQHSNQLGTTLAALLGS